MIVATPFGQETYLVRIPQSCYPNSALIERMRSIKIDRKENIYQNWYLTFPHQDGPEYNHSNTVLDGEFVIDVDPTSGAVSSLLVLDQDLEN